MSVLLHCCIMKRKPKHVPLPAAARFKGIDAFLYPLMPGSFQPSEVRKLHIDVLRDRYIQVFSASMGNHGLAKFYCCWSEEQYEAAVDEKFEKRLAAARSDLASRAALIMHRGMGLVAGAEGAEAIPPTVTAAMAKVVENMTGDGGVKGLPRKAYKLTVNGLQQPTPGPLSPARRGPGRPRAQPPEAAA